MKKIRTILTGILLILTLSIFTACGNNNAPADEAGTAAEENTTDTGTNENADAVNDKKDNENTDNSNNKVTDNEGVADDAAIDNGDTMSEGTDNDNVPNNTEDGSVAQDLGDGVQNEPQGGLGGAALQAVGLLAVQPVLDDVQIEGGQLHHADVIDGDAETR